MDLWDEDSKWRRFGSRHGRDDWEFYREKYGQHFSGGLRPDWDSGALKDLSSYAHSNSHFRIKKSLDEHDWECIMNILARIDVSRIEHMELELPHPSAAAHTAHKSYQMGKNGMDCLKPVLQSGRFSGLKTLRIRMSFRMPGYSIVYRLEQEESAALAKALEFGGFTNLLTLSLPACDVRAILGALKAGKISQLRSFSIRWGRAISMRSSKTDILAGILNPSLPNSVWNKKDYLLRSLSQNLWAVLKGGFFKSLQHLDLSESVLDRMWVRVPNVESWEVFTRGIESGKMPLLTSLCLSVRDVVQFTDLVPFNVLNPLENLMLDCCGINSLELDWLTDAIMKGGPLGLKRLDLRDNKLDDTVVPALVRLIYSDKLAQLQELDLSGNSGMGSRALVTLIESIQRGHHPSLKLVIWERNFQPGAVEAEAYVRHCGNNDGLADEWYQVLYGAPMVTDSTGPQEENATQYSVRRIELNDLMKEHKVKFNGDSPHYMPGNGSGLWSRMDNFQNILESIGFSNVEVLRLRIISEESQDPTGLGQGQEGSARLAAALMNGQFRSLFTRSLPACGASVLTLSLPACDASAILGAWNESHHNSHLKAFSVIGMEGLEDLARSSLHEKLDAALEGGCFKTLRHLELSIGVLDGVYGWEVVTRAIKSGNLPNCISLCLSQNALNQINLEDLTPLILSNSLESLVMDGCWINSEQVWSVADALMNSAGTGLALKWLVLHDNQLGNRAVDALVSLAGSDLLPQLQTLDLGMNKGIDFRAFQSLTDTIQRGRLPSLQTLNWVGSPGGDGAAEAIVQAYCENENLTTEFEIDWNEVSDPALQTKMYEYRAGNIRLRALKEEHKDVLEDVIPLTCAKVFLCGFPEVGKTTLRRALTHSTPAAHPLTEGRTRGIELSQLQDGDVTLTLWDIAGQEEYRVLHGTFFADVGLASGRATIFVLVLTARFTKNVADVEKDLLYWFRFIASSSQKHVKRHVAIVLNCFGGEQCTKAEMILWMTVIKKFEELFRDLLQICLVPFSLDVRFPMSVQPLKEYLFGQAESLLQKVRVPKVCFELQEELKRWPQDDKNRHLPIMSWETFEKRINLKRKGNHLSGTHLKAAALYLHETGGIIYFDQRNLSDPGSEIKSRSVVVVNPEWFCRQVVGELLLPKEMLEKGCSLIVNADGSIPTPRFQGYFKHLLVGGIRSDDIISMLERVGLCYRKGKEEIMVPALIQEDDDSLKLDWEGEGSQLVIGRCLATDDRERTAIPVTLFRRLQVELAQDLKFGGRGDSEYRAGKSFSNFKVGELSILIQFDAVPSNPSNDRIDILVKTVDSTNASLPQVQCVCEIMKTLQVLCFACCPGLKYDIKVIKPWSATENTPTMTERRLMSLREVKVLVMQDRQYSSWWVSGNAVELKTFLSDGEMKEVLEIKTGIKSGAAAGTDDVDLSEGTVEETARTDYYSDSEFSVDLEDPDFRVEECDFSHVSSQAEEEKGEL